MEKQLFPLWLVNYALGKTQGEEVMDFGEFISQVFSTPQPKDVEKKSTTADEIINRFAPIVELDRQKGG